MVPQKRSRRRVLQASGAAALVALAGCLGGDDSPDDTPDDSPDDGTSGDGDSDIPPVETADVRPYPEYVAPDGAAEVSAVYVDRVAVESTRDWFDEEFIAESEDPLLLLPGVAPELLARGSITLNQAGLGALLNDGFDSTVEASLIASGALVAAGSIDTDEIGERLQTETETPIRAFEQVDEVGAYSLYEPATGAENVIAVSETDIIWAGDRDPVERAIETVGGDRERATVAVGSFGWVLDAVGDHHVAFAGHGEPADDPQEEFDVLSEADSFASTHAFENGTIRAELAAVFGSEAALDRAADEIEETFGTEAAELSAEFGDDRVHIAGSYPGELLDR